jgi:hypothetical protein
MLVTRLGVSVENVVATIDVPRSHHGMERPEAKNSSAPRLALRTKNPARTSADRR